MNARVLAGRFMVLALAVAMVTPAVAQSSSTHAALVVVGIGTSVDLAVAQAAVAPVEADLAGIGGGDAIERAARVAERFPAPVETVVLATSEVFADGLAGGPLAAVHNAPLLLVQGDSVPGRTAEALERLQPGRVLVLGGPAAIPDSVVDVLAETIADVRRIAGPNRWATAAAVAMAGWPDGAEHVFLATGEDWPDALTSGAAAAARGVPVLLARGADLPAETEAALQALGPREVLVAGGTAAVAPAVLDSVTALGLPVRRVAGTNRFGTAAALALDARPDGTDVVYLVSGQDFPDALITAPLAARPSATAFTGQGAATGAVLLVERSRLPAETSAAIQALIRAAEIPPVAVPIVITPVSGVTLQGQPLTVRLPVTSGFDESDLEVVVEVQPDGGTLTAAGTLLTFTPRATFIGTTTGVVAVSDPLGQRATSGLTFTVQAGPVPPPVSPPSQPALAVTGGGVIIPAGETTTSTVTGTDYGAVPVGATATQTFVLTNTGGRPLQILGVDPPTGFTLTQAPASVLGGGASSHVVLAHSPDAVTVTSGNVDVRSNAPTTPTHAFAVTASGYQALEVTRDAGPVITPGDVTPSSIDGTDLAFTEIGSPGLRTFTITNPSTSAITIPGVVVAPTTTMQVVDGSARVVPAGGSTTVQVQFSGSEFVIAEADLLVQPAYPFRIRAMVVEPHPAMRVVGLDGRIIPSGNTVSLADGTDWGTIPNAAGTVNRLFTLINVGNTTVVVNFQGVSFGNNFGLGDPSPHGTYLPGQSGTLGLLHVPLPGPGTETGVHTIGFADGVLPAHTMNLRVTRD